jgi:hypothetical protein
VIRAAMPPVSRPCSPASRCSFAYNTRLVVIVMCRSPSSPRPTAPTPLSVPQVSAPRCAVRQRGMGLHYTAGGARPCSPTLGCPREGRHHQPAVRLGLPLRSHHQAVAARPLPPHLWLPRYVSCGSPYQLVSTGLRNHALQLVDGQEADG